ncbi:MAG: hypothetical protein KC618_05665, partial [Candidatus Omnitrophica bacterium]|nr:hypothetical protein [Candidatus Omnitrophota bacterium]
NKDGTVWGPGEQGFVLTFRQLSKEPEGMKFQPDGIALEQNKENGVWEETFYAIKLTDGYVLVSIAYDKDVNWDTVA